MGCRLQKGLKISEYCPIGPAMLPLIRRGIPLSSARVIFEIGQKLRPQHALENGQFLAIFAIFADLTARLQAGQWPGRAANFFLTRSRPGDLTPEPHRRRSS